MREIKFRVWSNDGQMMHYFDLVNYMQSNEIGQEDLVPTLDIEKTPLMQFTGLKDKNGVEIYEGDLLLHKYYLQPVECSFKDGSFHTGDVSILDNSLEVIGNVFQDPELVDK